jgi:hypothetical protein
LITTQSGIAFTPDDVLRLEDEGLYELVDGRLIEKPMSELAIKTAGFITVVLGNHVMPTIWATYIPSRLFNAFRTIRHCSVARILRSCWRPETPRCPSESAPAGPWTRPGGPGAGIGWEPHEW